MKIDKVIFSTSVEYSSFWNIQSQVFKEALGIEPICLLYGKKSDTTMHEKYGQVIEREFDESLPEVIQITWSKFDFPKTEEETTWMIGDIDMVPLNKQYFVDNIAEYEENAYLHLNFAGISKPRRGILDAFLREGSEAHARAAGSKGTGALGGTGRKEDSSVTLGKFMKAKTDALNESVLAGGMKKERITQGSNMRRPQAFVKDVEAGKYKKPNKDAAYYKSIGLTGKRGDRAVKDFFKPEDIRLKNIMAGNYMGGGMMNKPMGYKSGKSIKVKCKLGKNKPTKMY